MRKLLLTALMAWLGLTATALAQGTEMKCAANEHIDRVEGKRYFCVCDFGWERPKGDRNADCVRSATPKTCNSAGQFTIDRLARLKTNALRDGTVSVDLVNNARLACQGLTNIYRLERLGSCEATCGQIFCFGRGGIMDTYNRYRNDPKSFKFVFMTLVPPDCK